MPTLVIHGTNDAIVPYSHGKRIHGALKDSELGTVEGAGHNDILSSPGTLELLVNFAKQKGP